MYDIKQMLHEDNQELVFFASNQELNFQEIGKTY